MTSPFRPVDKKFDGLLPNESIISLIHYILSSSHLPARGYIEPALQEEIK